MIIEGTVVTDKGAAPGQQVEADPETGLITRIGPGLGPPDAVFAGLILPGFIDSHVYARECVPPAPGDARAWRKYYEQMMKETWAAAAQAALQGGVTSFLDMPDNSGSPDTPAAHAEKWALMRALPVAAVPVAGIGPGSKPVPGMPHKLQLGPATTAIAFGSLSEAEAALPRYQGCQVIVPCAGFRAGQLTPCDPSPDGPDSGADELTIVRRALEWPDKFGLALHLSHISTAAALEAVIAFNRGRQPAQRATCEVAPHHLFFSMETLGESDATIQELLLTDPPLRSEHDRQRLVAGLRDGDIDVLASEHEPHTLLDKLRYRHCGLPHLDTMGGFVGWLMHSAGFTPRRIAECFSQAPARLWNGVLPGRGALAPGLRADITVFDPAAATPVPFPGRTTLSSGRTLKTRCGWSPFGGRDLPGAVRAVFVGGQAQYICEFP